MGLAKGHQHHKPDGAFSSLLSGPETVIITPAEAKEHLRVSHTDEDTLITSLIQAATDYLDADHGILGRALITQRWQLTMKDFPTYGDVHLPVPRVQQVTSFKYYDADNVQQDFGVDQYRLVTNDEDAIIEFVDGATIPTVYDRADAVQIQYDTGYGDAATDIPQALRVAMLLMIGNWYEHREAVLPQSLEELPLAVRSLLQPFRISRSFI